ncbi:hypothetical protein [Sphingobium yanoikuyae]|uniref:hypothetical protein n=1 Tax=Sphingobium yanoikuyae TaxID=13690 RepID=UPI002FDE089A
MTKSRNRLLAGVAMTAMERRVGRYLRGPDHDAGTGGGDAGGVTGASGGNGASGAGAAADAVAGDAGAAGTGSGDDASAGSDASGDDTDDGDTALGGAGKKAGAEGEAGGEGEQGEQAPAHVIPEGYELTAPDGMTIDAALLTEATPIFKEAGLSNDQAQAILPAAKSLVEKTQQSTVQNLIDAGNQQRKAWLDAAKADEQIGGAKWDASLDSAGRALDALGHAEGSEFRAALNETGFGNHPEMIRIFARIGEMVGEDGHFVRADAGAPVNEPAWKRLYPND